MLNRLPELRRAARLREELDALPSEHMPEEHLVYAVASDERSMRAICNDIRARVAELRRVGAEIKKSILPGRLQDLQQQLLNKDAACQRLVHQSKELLDTLGGGAPDGRHDDGLDAGHFLQKVRDSAADYWREQVKAVILEFFEVRGTLRDEIRVQQRRRLRLGYPEADEEVLEMALASPELAAQALAARADGDHVPLRAVLASLDSMDDRRIEEAAKSLKLIFLQFAELIDVQGETLEEIEGNIDSTIEHVEKARVQLEQSRVLQSKNWRKAMKMKLCGCCVFLVLLVLFAPTLMTSVAEAAGHPIHIPHWEFPHEFPHFQVNLVSNATDASEAEAPPSQPAARTRRDAPASLLSSATAAGRRQFIHRPASSRQRPASFLWRGVATPEAMKPGEYRPRRRLGTGAARLESLVPP